MKTKAKYLLGEYIGAINSGCSVVFPSEWEREERQPVERVVNDKARLMFHEGAFHLWWNFKNGGIKHQQFPTVEALTLAAEMLAASMRAKRQ